MWTMTFVIVATMIGGAFGGLAGREVGRSAPQFVSSLAFGRPDAAPATFRPEEFGLGLGIVSGLFFGAGASVVLVVVIALRDAWLARADSIRRSSASGDRA